MNRFEVSLERIKKGVFPNDNWTEADYQHYSTVIEALERCAEEEKRSVKNEYIDCV